MKKIILLSLLLSSSAFSQWTPTGPRTVSTGGMVALSNGALLVGTRSSHGVYKSTDSGANWSTSSTGLPSSVGAYGLVYSMVNKNDTVFIIAVNPSSGTSTVYRSTNSGDNWTPANTGLPGNVFNKLFAGPNCIFLPVDNNSLYRTTDGGQNWVLANTGLPTTAGITTMGLNGDEMYAWVTNNFNLTGLYRSTNNGDNWTLVRADIDPNISYLIPWSFVWNGSTMLAGTTFGLYRSTDSGTSWTHAENIDLAGSINQGMQLVYHNGTLYCGTPGIFGGTGHFLKSTNDGDNWFEVTNTLPSYERRSLQAFATVGNTFYAGIGVFGVYRTSDGGTTWESRNGGFPIQPVTNSMIKAGSQILLGTTSGIFQSSDNGISWYQSQEGIEPANYPNITALAANGDTVFAGSSEGRAYRSVDAGQTFTPTAHQLTDGGAVKAFAFTGNAVLAIMTTSNAVYRTTDNGVTWTASSTGITNKGGLTVANIGNDLYVGTVSGLFRSIDGGVNWVRLGATVLVDNSQVTGIATIGSDIYLSVNNIFTASGGIYKSSDNGENWAQLTIAFFGTFPAPYSLVSMNNNLYTSVFAISSSSTVMQGVGGETWTDFGQGLQIPGIVRVNSFLVNGNELFAAFANVTGGSFDVWRRASPTTGIKETSASKPASFALQQNYPNPFNPTTKIRYEISGSGFVSLKVFDVLGSEVADLVNEYKPAGNHDVNFDASKLSSGVYFYKLQTGNFTSTKKMIFMK